MVNNPPRTKDGHGREEISDSQSKGYFKREKALKDGEAKKALKASGGTQYARSKRIEKEAAQAEAESYKLRNKSF